MRFLPITSENEGRRLKSLPVIAVDLGFSGQRRTTGVAWSLPAESDAKKRQFGEAVIAVAEKCQQVREIVLIIEAPLSAAFDSLRNPRPRGRFECKPQARWWSVGPGAATALSALFFLRQLESQLNAARITIHLVEGFVSGTASGDHARVAVALRDGFRGNRKCRWHSVSDDGDVISVLDWLECESPKKPPAVLEPVAA